MNQKEMEREEPEKEEKREKKERKEKKEKKDKKEKKTKKEKKDKKSKKKKKKVTDGKEHHEQLQQKLSETKKHQIIPEKDIQKMVIGKTTFQDIGIVGHLAEHLGENMKIRRPSPIQMATIPPLLQVCWCCCCCWWLLVGLVLVGRW